MASHLEPQRREAIKFAISSTQVAKLNLKAIVKAYYITYSTVLRLRNDLLLEMGAAKCRNIRVMPGPKLDYNEEVIYFIT